jgi:aminopeptidase N
VGPRVRAGARNVNERRPFPLPGAQPQYGPDRTVAVEHLALVLRPDLAHRTLAGEVTHHVRAIETVRRLRLDAVDLEIDAVRSAAGAALPFHSTARELSIDLPAPLAPGERYAFTVLYRAVDPRRGIYFIDRARQVWTQSQDTDARSWIPCFDHPAEKQTTSTTIVVEQGCFALGNGALLAREDAAGLTTFRYEQRVPHSTYLLTLVAGDFREIAQPHPRVPIFYYVPPGREADGERAFGNTPKMLDAFEATLGVPYPFERYGQIAVADFIFGGMENTTATTQTDRTLHDERAHLDFSSDPLVSHELAHQWFGDLVTCRDWSQAWLNEGFATYLEAVWAEHDRGWDEYQRAVFEIVGRYLDEDEERYRRPIVCNIYRDPIELFDRHLYEKGAAVLHTLRGELGWERLRRALRRYLTDNATRTVETIDLIRAIEVETGRNLRGFFAQWIERGGHPELEVRQTWDAARGMLTVEVEQVQPVDDANPPYAFDLDLGFVATAPERIERDAGPAPLTGERRTRVRVARAKEAFSFAFDAAPALVRIDPAAWILGTMTYGLGTEAHVAILTADPSPPARIRAAKALAKDPARAARVALGSALTAEPFWGVAVEIASALGQTRTAFARDALLDATGHPHPKVRRAVATALGEFRETAVADALIALRADPSYFVVAAAYTSLGKTRDPRAFEVLAAGIEQPSWNETIAAGAANGLAEIADVRAFAPLAAAIAPERPEALRRVATGALARLGVLADAVRSGVVDALERALDDPAYLVRHAAYAAAEKIADARLLDRLDRAARSDLDGRLRRDAAEAAIRVREAAKTPVELVRLREEVDRLREDLNRLRERSAE